MRKSILIICVCVLIMPMIAWSQGRGPGLGPGAGPGQGAGLGPGGGSGQGLGLSQEERIELTPWWDRPVVRDLGLSEDQLRQIREIVRGSRDQLIQLRAAVRIAEGHLADAMSTEVVNERATAGSIEDVIRARGDLMRATSQMSLRIRQVLTYPQWQELRRREAQRILPGIRARQRAGRGD